MHSSIIAARGEVVPPIGAVPTEVLTAILDKVTKKEEVRSVRLTCRAFRECSWSTFGSSISNDTVFDLQSRASMANLDAISRHEHLAPLIKSLKIGAGTLPVDYPGSVVKHIGTYGQVHDYMEVQAEAWLSSEIRDELERLHDEGSLIPHLSGWNVA